MITMKTTTQADASPSKHQHKRTTSSVLKSVMPKSHQRKPSSKDAQVDMNETNENRNEYTLLQNPMLPTDHPSSRQHLREGSGNRNPTPASPRKSVDVQKENSKAPEENKKMTRSTSFKAVMDKEKARGSKQRSERQEEKQMKKSKSSTSLSALLLRPRSSTKSAKEKAVRRQNDKENETPHSSVEMASPPIWAEFATQAFQEPSTTTKVPLNDRFDIHEEVALYTPRDYSPLKQRIFQGSEQPTLSRRRESKPRPKSECLTSGPTPASFTETVSNLRRSSRDKGRAYRSNQAHQASENVPRTQNPFSEDKTASGRPSVDHRKVSDESSSSDPAMGIGGSRVMAAVAALNGRSKELPKEPTQDPPAPELDANAIEAAFESLLEARNVPQNTRDKMRFLDTKIKADFIKKDKFGSGSASSTEGLSLQSSSRPSIGKRSQTADGSMSSTGEATEAAASIDSPKKSRPRSMAFTFSKGDQSPSKKQKSERPSSHQKTKSGGLTSSISSTSLASVDIAQGSSFFSRASKPAAPEDYITYLKKVQKPEVVEVGKVHKLRQLLRNETVGWVETFISQGGMTELVELLYRIIKVEWRVEHEDSLLHETLLCLKALSTTSSAHHQLVSIQSTLFPTLLGMLFDKENKGPSEFTTRNTIITLLHTYLCSAPKPDLTSRACIILSYLRDPAAPEEAQPHGFIASIYHPRPYRVWFKEMDNVVKEVFWIFLHHVNIIPYPQMPDGPSKYTERHFPREHPPVPAAPYIGGVEWDATNYLTAHIDLLNGIIASLPTTEERNALRQELKDSGFERVMGISLRTCKEELYGCVHEALSTWVGAAMEDGWLYQDVRQGPRQESIKSPSPRKSPKKKDAPPKLEIPKLDLGGGSGIGGDSHGRWL